MRQKLRVPNAERIFHLGQAFAGGMSIEEAFELTKIDPWFLHNIRQIAIESIAPPADGAPVSRERMLRLKKLGFSDRQLAVAAHVPEEEIRRRRKEANVIPTYRLVDTCAAEFEAYTPTTTPPTAMKTSAGMAKNARS